MIRRFVRRRGYAAAALALLLIEGAIAWWIHDRFIRPHFGDVLAVVLVYLILRAVTPLRVWPAAAAALVIALAIETAQAFDLLARLGIGNAVVRTVLGHAFDWSDMLAYVIGIAATLTVEWRRDAMSNP